MRITRGGQNIDWQLPVELSFSVVDGQTFHLDDVSLKSDFAWVTGRGTLQDGLLQAEADLDQLVTQLSQIVDTNGIYARGNLRSTIKWQETQTSQLDVDARTTLTDFVMMEGEQVLGEENELTVLVNGSARVEQGQIIATDKARLDITSKGDFFIAELASPVTHQDKGESWGHQLSPLWTVGQLVFSA